MRPLHFSVLDWDTATSYRVYAQVWGLTEEIHALSEAGPQYGPHAILVVEQAFLDHPEAEE